MEWTKFDIDHKRTVESRDVDASKKGRWLWDANPARENVRNSDNGILRQSDALVRK